MNNSAQTPIDRLMKNDLMIIFMKNTRNDKNIIGDEQYKIKHNVWMIGLRDRILTFLIPASESSV